MAKRAFKRVYIKKHFLLQVGDTLITTAKGIRDKISVSGDIPVPVIVIVVFTGQISDLEATRILRRTDRSPSLEQTELNQTTLIHDSLSAYADQAEQIFNAKTPGDEAVITGNIINIGFQVKEPAARQQQEFEVIETAHGQAKITQRLPDNKKVRAIYVWSYTTTPADPASWSFPVLSVGSKVTLAGLQSEKRGYFRGAVLLPGGRNPLIDINDVQIVWIPDIISALIP